jgi:hypothetical protein
LRSICLPASLRGFHARAFTGSATTNIEIESGKEFFCVRGYFIIGIKPPISVVCYFGRLATVAYDDDIRTIANCVFVPAPFVELVTVGAGSLLRTIGKTVFKGCESLESIAIPSTVTSIGGDAFARYTR